MHIPTHLMSGWVIGNQFSLSARQRGFCMLAASLADLDGLSLLFGQEAYWNYHHLLCHNLLFAVILAAALAWPAPGRAASFLIFFSLAHVHLLLDFFGSGPGWPIYYLFPFSRYPMVNPHSWEFFSWQNMAVAGGLLAWTIQIAIWKGRTPVETIAPRLNRQWVAWLRRMTGHAAGVTEVAAENGLATKSGSGYASRG